MTPLHYSMVIATCAVLIVSVHTDVRYGKIFNAVTVPFAALGLVLNVADKGWSGIPFSLEGIVLGLSLFFLSAFLGRILGAGDCKLFAAVGALQGPGFLAWVVVYSLLAGGAIALLFALKRGVMAKTLDRLWKSVYLRMFWRTPMDITHAAQVVRIPYALAICAGGLMVVAGLRGVGG